MPSLTRPKVSIVTISFNQAQYLSECIESVISQRDVDLEYIIVDPGSTDGSKEIIDSYRPHLSKVIETPDSGPGDGLNNGLAQASYSLFGYLNADDRLLPNALSKAARHLEDNPLSDVIYGNAFITDEYGRKIRRAIPSRAISDDGYARGSVYIIQQAAFMRSAALRAVGGFNPDNRTSWDGEAFYRMAAAGSKFTRVNDYLAEFRIYSSSISGSGRLQEAYEADRRRMFNEHFGRDPNITDRVRARIWRAKQLALDPQRIVNKITSLRKIS